MRFYYIFLFLLLSIKLSAQTPKLETLERQVNLYNDSLQYEKSIKLLSDFLASSTSTNYEKCYAYIFKAHTYKYIFNYAKTLYNLELAFAEGAKSKQKTKMSQIIKAEKALIYFDILEFARADTLMKEIAATNYKDIAENTKVWLFTQEGHLLMKEKKYDLAQKRLDEAIGISSKKSPEQLPVIYGKKIELFNEMGEYEKRDSLFSIAIGIAKSSNQIKYQMYLYQTMNHIYDRNKDYKKAYYTHRKYDSLDNQFGPHYRSSNLDLLEKKLDEKNKEIILKKDNSLIFTLLFIIIGLLVLTYFLTKIYKSYKRERDLVEKENQLISSEVKALSKKLEENKNEPLDLSKFRLTERQLQIIELIRLDKTYREIAEALYISENTVKYHIKSIYKILNIKHRSEIK